MKKLEAMFTVCVFYCMILTSEKLCAYAFSKSVINQQQTNSIWNFELDNVQDNKTWQLILKTAVDVFEFQNNLDIDVKENITKLHCVVLYNSGNFKIASEFLERISMLKNDIQFITFEFNDEDSTINNISQIITMLWLNQDNVRNVIVLCDNLTSVANILTNKELENNLTFTGVLHATEWMIISPSNSDTLIDLQQDFKHIDFITVVFGPLLNVTSIAQKCRNETLQIKAHYSTSGGLFQQCRKCNRQKLLDKYDFNGVLRKGAYIFLKSQKTNMAGMHLPVSLIFDDFYMANRDKDGILKGYSADLLKLVAQCTGITYRIVPLLDKGFYGLAEPNHRANGITGQLSRREVAFTTMPMSRLQNRENFIDCIPVLIIRSPFVVIYRLSDSNKEELDMFYTAIFKPEMFYILFGPLLIAAVIGAVLHVTTHSCTKILPGAVSRSDVRHILSCPEHVCFKDLRHYPGQSGRVLQTSWALTWFILSSIYTTFLVTTFTVKPQELVLNTLEKVLHKEDFQIGVTGSASATQDFFKASPDTILNNIWDRLIQLNTTDPRTFEVNMTVHANRVLNGHFIWIASDCAFIGVCESHFYDNSEYIRGYMIDTPNELTDSFFGIPKNVFYKDTLYKQALKFEEAGIFQYLRKRYFSQMALSELKTGKIMNQQTPVKFSRIKLPVYAVLGGVGLSMICLVVEIAIKRWKM